MKEENGRFHTVENEHRIQVAAMKKVWKEEHRQGVTRWRRKSKEIKKEQGRGVL